MPSFTDLYSKKTKPSSGGGVSFNDFYGLGDEEIKNRLTAQTKANKVAVLQQQADQLKAEAIKNTVKNQSLLTQIKRFGPSAALDTVKGVGESIISLPKSVAIKVKDQYQYLSGGKPNPDHIPTAQIASAQKQAQNLPADLKNKTSRISADAGLTLLKMVKDGKSTKEIGTFLDQAVAAKTAADKKLAGTTLEAASYAAGGGSVAKSFAEGGVRAAAGDVLGTGISGGVGGAGNVIASNPNAGALDVAKGTAAGVATGVGASLVGAVAGQALKKDRKVVTNAILDESRQLPEHATPGAPVIGESRQLGPGVQDPNLAVPVTTPANPSLLNQLDSVEKKITAAQKGKAITADEARGLMQERQTIIEQIQQGASKETQQALGASQDVISAHQNTIRTDGPGEHFVPRVAQRTEARAVADGLAGKEGFQNLPTATRLNLDQQDNLAVDFVKTAPNDAKAVAMGTAPPPPGVESTAVYKAVEADAAKKGDAATLQALAEESTIPKQATQAGQFNAALATKDPESPVDIMRQINSIRGKSSNADVAKFVTQSEAQQITTMAQDVALKKEAAISHIDDAKTRLEYGRARVALDNYTDALKAPALKRTARQVIQQEGFPGAAKSVISTIGGTAKSIRATLDNSALGRQGIKVLFTHPTIWAKNSLKSFSDLVRQFGDKPVMDELKADIISRPNSLSGAYKQIGADVFNTTEEQFPEHLPERIWGIKRAVKASDAAYTGFVQRSRADLADAYIKIAKKSGVDITDKAQAAPIGKMVNALTGRGYLTHQHNLLNNVFFSPRLLKSHIDVLTAHAFQKGVTPFVRQQAAKNLLKIIGGTAAALTLADKVRPGSVEWDPRSANFGKVKIGDTRFDLTGGMSAVTTLAARLATTSTKSSTSGDVTSLTSGKFGAQTGLDVVNDFFQNKLAPAPGVIAALLKGSDFNGKPTRNVKYVATNLAVPLSITNYQELKNDPKSANKLVGVIADGLGFSTNTYGKQQTDWRNSTSKELQQFKQSVPEATLLKANDEYNQQYSKWLDGVNKNTKFNKLNADDRTAVRTNKQNQIRTKVLKDNGFTYKRAAPNKSLKGF